MAIKRFQRSIGFSNDEWNAVTGAADRGENFERAAEAARIARAETFGPDGSDTGLSAASPAIPLRSP